MTVFADLWAALPSHPLGETLPGYADVAVAGTPARPASDAASYVWISGDGRDGYLEDVRDVGGVTSLARLEELSDRTLARVELSGAEPEVFRAVDDAGGTVLAYRGVGEGWTVRTRFPGRDGIAECYRLCDDRSVKLTLRRVYSDSGVTGSVDYGLTPRQADALALATDRGYFEVPRQSTLSDLAAELGVSEQAVSELLRRGMLAVLSETGIADGAGAGAGGG